MFLSLRLVSNPRHLVVYVKVSSGLKGGAEAAIHSMRQIFQEDTTDAVILVDAANAFNRLNRQAGYVHECYQNWTLLVLCGKWGKFFSSFSIILS